MIPVLEENPPEKLKVNKQDMERILKIALEDKLKKNAYLFLHEIPKLISELFNDQLTLLQFLNKYDFLDLSVFESALILITVTHIHFKR